MEIYPVLDIQRDIVVHAVRGERERYGPLKSRLVDSSEPLAVARALRARFGIRKIYLADLDALGGGPPATGLYGKLIGDGFQLLLDAGVRSLERARLLQDAGVEEVVVALETLPGPEFLGEALESLGATKVVFSLDLKDGQPLGSVDRWEVPEAEAIAREAYAIGVRRMIVLDLAQVGSGGGPVHLDLLKRLRRELPDVELITGGGVRSLDDLESYQEVGVHAVLVASAIHSGELDLNAWME